MLTAKEDFFLLLKMRVWIFSHMWFIAVACAIQHHWDWVLWHSGAMSQLSRLFYSEHVLLLPDVFFLNESFWRFPPPFPIPPNLYTLPHHLFYLCISVSHSIPPWLYNGKYIVTSTSLSAIMQNALLLKRLYSHFPWFQVYLSLCTENTSFRQKNKAFWTVFLFSYKPSGGWYKNIYF